MVHVNDVSVREAKQAKNTHQYIYYILSTQYSTFRNSVNLPVRHKTSYCGPQELINYF